MKEILKRVGTAIFLAVLIFLLGPWLGWALTAYYSWVSTITHA